MAGQTFEELLIAAYNAPDPYPLLFQVGQQVRVRVGVVNDGQTPEYWKGAIAKVLRSYSTGLHKEHWYVLEHPNGAIEEFREDELDNRWIKKK